MPSSAVELNKEQGRVLARDKRTKHIQGSLWLVPSQSGAGSSYVVDVGRGTCTCLDYELRGTKCKHMWAVEIIRARPVGAELADAPDVTAPAPTKKTYRRDWSAYNAAQCNEKSSVQELLRALCSQIRTPPHPGRGPKPLPLSDVVFGMAMKVYTTVSGRRATTDIKACAEAGHITRAPHYNCLFSYFEKPELTPLLVQLVEESAAPLKEVETCFAADSTGFATVRYVRWYDHKYGREMKEHGWVKAHAMTGVRTNVITAIRVTDHNVADCPQLPELLQSTDRRFNIAEVSADKAYLSHQNLAAIEAVGALPYIPFKSNSREDGSPAWRRMRGLFMYRRDEFLKHYHARSNVESTFSAVKAKFGDSVRSKAFTAQVNEVLCKCLCHNLARVVHGIHSLGIEPTFEINHDTEEVA